jgi:hypothetical protein
VRDGHHAASHDNLSDGYERIARFHLSQLAYLATKLEAMPEGDGTVLDNSCLMFLSNMWNGSKHINYASAGRARRRARRHARNRPLARLPGARRREPQDVQPVPRHHGRMGIKLDASAMRRAASRGCSDAESKSRI